MRTIAIIAAIALATFNWEILPTWAIDTLGTIAFVALSAVIIKLLNRVLR